MLFLDVFVPAEREITGGTSFSSVFYSAMRMHLGFLAFSIICFFGTFFIVIDSHCIIAVNTCKSCFFFIYTDRYLSRERFCRIALYIRLVYDFRLLRNKM